MELCFNHPVVCCSPSFPYYSHVPPFHQSLGYVLYRYAYYILIFTVSVLIILNLSIDLREWIVDKVE